jgi:hypothetical protein
VRETEVGFIRSSADYECVTGLLVLNYWRFERTRANTWLASSWFGPAIAAGALLVVLLPGRLFFPY